MLQQSVRFDTGFSAPNLRIIGLIFDPRDKSLLGFRILEEKSVQMANMELVQALRMFMPDGLAVNGGLTHGKVILNQGRDAKFKIGGFSVKVHFQEKDSKPQLLMTDGTELAKYPIIDASTMQVVNNDVVIVRAKVQKLTTGEVTGYLVTDGNGLIECLTPQDLASYKDVGYLNVKLTEKNGVPTFKALKGEIPTVDWTDVYYGSRSVKERWG